MVCALPSHTTPWTISDHFSSPALLLPWSEPPTTLTYIIDYSINPRLASWLCGILVPQPGIEPTTPAVEVQNSNHCIAREVSEGYCLSQLRSLICPEAPVASILLRLKTIINTRGLLQSGLWLHFLLLSPCSICASHTGLLLFLFCLFWSCF